MHSHYQDKKRSALNEVSDFAEVINRSISKNNMKVATGSTNANMHRQTGIKHGTS